MLDLIGQRIGQYEIISRFGEGGMATVFRARQLNVKREVAIKVISPGLAQKETFARRFERESQTVAQLSHPHIVKLFDYGTLRGFHMRLLDPQFDPKTDIYYFVMELLTGGSLSARIRKGPLPLETVAQILDQVASALDYAHGQGVIHRDLKPPNVLFDEGGNAFLTDFGIAKLMGDTTTLTQEGMTMGTPSYMAPEQWRGDDLSPRADIYSLGVVLFEMLTGKLPFVGSNPYRVMHMHIHEPPPSVYAMLPGLPPGLDGIINRALAKAPEARYEKAMQMATDFKDLLAGQRVPDAPALPAKPEPQHIIVPQHVLDPAPPSPSEFASPTPVTTAAPAFGVGGGTRLLFGAAVIIIVLLLIIVILLLTQTGGAQPSFWLQSIVPL